MNLALVAAISLGLGIIFIFWGIAQIVSAPAKVIEERLDRFAAREIITGPAREQRIERRAIPGLDSLVRRTRFGEGIARELASANLKLTVSEFLAFTLLSTLGVGLLAYLLYYRSTIMGVAGAAVGFYLPRLFVKMAQQRRLKAFNSQLADAITLLANSMRSGYSLLQAMATVAKEMPPPISEEFGRVVYEVDVGLPIQQALNNMVRRVKSDDLDLMATAIIIQHDVGGNLADILDTINETIRERVRIQGEIRALTAQQRLTGYVIGFLPFGLAMIIYLINRSYISNLFTDPCGLILMGVGLFMMLIGAFFIRKVTQIEV
ncbi:MAG: type II secretion system F family protein [Anaerolineae bacterium]|nr:type II secretion system F family protein [Anaerolineae bacterium]MDW8102857.1 type II secretion system F family protein [Anaerolineae bacterium]